MTAPDHFDVAIAGAGPAGAHLANALGLAGFRVELKAQPNDRTSRLMLLVGALQQAARDDVGLDLCRALEDVEDAGVA